ncbi:hypothetical protein FOXB_00692 [Fusarium oxysporum f. sp. conglutinans Fo5176]|uniref:Uncharacterized protein n=1 Tax=Fusarium oxysporum (strain Fo5176) TaxID=660025 RepID=F9F2R7_FUSOF|nr:hypothetical protein FOXB_00692 [Fusarium oxysporum f. sp. conglutinans Fo5176]
MPNTPCKNIKNNSNVAKNKIEILEKKLLEKTPEKSFDPAN